MLPGILLVGVDKLFAGSPQTNICGSHRFVFIHCNTKPEHVWLNIEINYLKSLQHSMVLTVLNVGKLNTFPKWMC